jgi:hypothetical protein
MRSNDRATGHFALRRLGSLLAAAALGLAGCAERDPLQSMRLYPVKGRVLLEDGKPLTSGRIVFVATKSSLTSTSPLESDGTFTVKGRTGDGLPEGEYRIRIDFDDSKLPIARGVKRPNLPLPFAQKYADEDASYIKRTVMPDEAKNNFEITLTKS